MIFDRPKDTLAARFTVYLVDDEGVHTEAFPDRLFPRDWTIVSKGKLARLRVGGPGRYVIAEGGVRWQGPLATTGLILVWSEKQVVVASWNRGPFGRTVLAEGDSISAEGLCVLVLR